MAGIKGIGSSTAPNIFRFPQWKRDTYYPGGSFVATEQADGTFKYWVTDKDTPSDYGFTPDSDYADHTVDARHWSPWVSGGDSDDDYQINEWTINHPYDSDDLVSWQGDIYRATKTHPGTTVSPELDSDNWELFSSGGISGISDSDFKVMFDSEIRRYDSDLWNKIDSEHKAMDSDIKKDLDSDLKSFDSDIRKDLDSDLKSVDSDIRHDVDSDLKSVDSDIRHDVDSDLKSFDSDIRKDLDSDMKSMDSDIRHDVDSDMKSMDSDIRSDFDSDLKVIEDKITGDLQAQFYDSDRAYNFNDLVTHNGEIYRFTNNDPENVYNPTRDPINWVTIYSDEDSDLNSIIERIDSDIKKDLDSDLKSFDSDIRKDLDSDLKLLDSDIRKDLDSDIKSLDSDIRKDLDSDLKSFDSDIRKDLDSDIKSLDSDIKKDLDSDIKALDSDIRTDLDSDLKSMDSDIRSDFDSDLKVVEDKVTGDLQAQFYDSDRNYNFNDLVAHNGEIYRFTNVNSENVYDPTRDPINWVTIYSDEDSDFKAEIERGYKAADSDLLMDVDSDLKALDSDIRHDLDSDLKKALDEFTLSDNVKKETITLVKGQTDYELTNKDLYGTTWENTVIIRSNGMTYIGEKDNDFEVSPNAAGDSWVITVDNVDDDDLVTPNKFYYSPGDSITIVEASGEISLNVNNDLDQAGAKEYPTLTAMEADNPAAGTLGVALSPATWGHYDGTNWILQNRGIQPWSADVTYSVGDWVYHERKLWRCDITGAVNSPSIDPGSWHQVNTLPSYSATGIYYMGDIVEYNGTFYSPIVARVSNVVPTTVTSWKAISRENVSFTKPDTTAFKDYTATNDIEVITQTKANFEHIQKNYISVHSTDRDDYAVNDLVLYDGYLYRCTTDNTLNLPTNTVDWTKLETASGQAPIEYSYTPGLAGLSNLDFGANDPNFSTNALENYNQFDLFHGAVLMRATEWSWNDITTGKITLAVGSETDASNTYFLVAK